MAKAKPVQARLSDLTPGQLGRPRRAVPKRVERSFHVGREHRPRGRHAFGHRGDRFRRNREDGLMRMQREHDAAD